MEIEELVRGIKLLLRYINYVYKYLQRIYCIYYKIYSNKGCRRNKKKPVNFQ